ncbi:MAG: hypothetical protein PHY59_01205 [Methanobacterium sp.]|nr:hypothetical protein [Methanobacterium sp.]
MLEGLLIQFKDIIKLIQKVIAKKIIHDIQRLTNYPRNPLIPQTSN